MDYDDDDSLHGITQNIQSHMICDKNLHQDYFQTVSPIREGIEERAMSFRLISQLRGVHIRRSRILIQYNLTDIRCNDLECR